MPQEAKAGERKKSMKGLRCNRERADGSKCPSGLNRGHRRCPVCGIKEAKWLADRIRDILPTHARTLEIPEHFGKAGRAIEEHGEDADAEDVLAVGYFFIREYPELFGLPSSA